MQTNLDKLDKVDFKTFNKAFFADKSLYNTLSNKAKEEHFFMLCRTISKIDPMYINKFQEHKHWSVVDLLHNKFYEGRIPSYVYISSKQGKSEKLLYENYSDDVIKYVMELTSYEFKSIVSMCKMMPHIAKPIFEDAKKVVKGKLSQRKK